jgi:hypothetical protein
MNYSMLMASTRGTCNEMAALAIFVMRALGIPVTWDYTPKWSGNYTGHSWNAVCDSTGRHISFMGTETGPGAPPRVTHSMTTKVNRVMFARQHQLGTEDIPSGLRDPYIKDVSLEYKGYSEVQIPIWNGSAHSTNYAYLATIDHNGQWVITSREVIAHQQLKTPVNNSILYLPVFYENKQQIPAGYPFILEKTGETRFFEPDTIHYEMIQILEISLSNQLWLERMLLSVFEGANRSDFSDARIIHTIKQLPGNYFQSVKIQNPTKVRYFRYVPQKHALSFCNVAEIKIYDTHGTQIHGTPIGTPGTWLPSTTHDKAFDGDINTYYDSDNNDSWTGLDLKEAKRIGEICYLPRTDEKVGIYEGHVYELFFWNGQKWQTLGKQKAVASPLQYRIPTNALLCMRNITMDKTGRIFTVQNGMKEWL